MTDPDPISNVESLATTPVSFSPTGENGDSSSENSITATIVHHNGTATVEDFESIQEVDPAVKRVVVEYEDGSVERFHSATITSVEL